LKTAGLPRPTPIPNSKKLLADAEAERGYDHHLSWFAPDGLAGVHPAGQRGGGRLRVCPSGKVPLPG
jgi:hypothetical protein